MPCPSQAPSAKAGLDPGAWHAHLHDGDRNRLLRIHEWLRDLSVTVSCCDWARCPARSFPGAPGFVALEQYHTAPSSPFQLVYADRASTFSLGERSRLLLTGAVELLDSAAADFERRLRTRVVQVMDRAEVVRRRQLSWQQRFAALGLVGQSAVMQTVFAQVGRIAPLNDIPVLITGETGTGKELLARALHQLNPRRANGPFVALNCAAISADLAEAELFGHRKGGFTGASRDRPGLFRAANGGTLFLDEIAELPLSLQGKLLRALQERRVLPVGDEREVPVDVRVVAASNRELEPMIAAGQFRRDLYHRLRILMIRLPPLAERRQDIAPLVRFFLHKHAAVRTGPAAEPDDEFLAALSSVPLPGNVRELENIVCQALVYGDNPVLGLADLPGEILERVLATEGPRETEGNTPAPAVPDSQPVNLASALAAYERVLLDQTLKTTRGNRTRAARLLGLTPRSIYNKIRKYGIDT